MTSNDELSKGEGRRASFEREALPHTEAVYRFALRLSSSSDRAADLVQDTFLRAFSSWDLYTPGTQCKSWLFTICRNLYLRQRERARRHDEILAENAPISRGELEIVNPVWSEASQADPEGRFFSSLVDESILRAIESLPEEYRTAVVLSDVEGLKYAEIAEVMDVPVGTVKSRLFRGRRSLQETLYDYAVEMGYVKAAAEPDDDEAEEGPDHVVS
jgi:RNA polymerase sigma-70 factor (ECF subfamily)